MGSKYVKHILFVVVLLFIFRDLVGNMSTNLPDWRDYAFITWITNQNINHIKTLDFANIFNTNAFFPYTNTLFLSETFFTLSLVGLPISLFVKDPIILFNLLFLLTFVLNYASLFLFWKKITKSEGVAFIGSVATVFSPYFYAQFGHFQMITYWPLMFSLYFLVDSKRNKKKLFLVGLFLAIQFLASVYLTYFLCVAILLYLFFDFLKNRNIKSVLVSFFIIFSLFLALDGVFIKGYMNTQKYFGVKREYGEYVGYSAHLTDYLFPRQQSYLYNNTFFKKWNAYNKHNLGEVASFPGFVLTITALLGIFGFKNSKYSLVVIFKKEAERYWFLSLVAIGFLFSLGPRLNFNGVYSGIPTIYTLLLKIPFVEAIRGLERWSFLFYFGLTYFSLLYIKTIKKRYVLFIVLTILLLELAPFKTLTYAGSYINNNDEVLRDICSIQKTAILEIPVTHFDTTGSIAEGVSYITTRELATLYNHCHLINGYTGYDLPSIANTKNQIYESIASKDSQGFYKTISESGAQILVLNRKNLLPETITTFNKFLLELVKTSQLKPLGKDVYKIN